jgi:hypothetical protein
LSFSLDGDFSLDIVSELKFDKFTK